MGNAGAQSQAGSTSSQIGNTSSQTGSASSQPGRNAGSQSQAGSTSSQPACVSSPQAGSASSQANSTPPNQKGMQAVQALNPTLPVLLSRHPVVVLPRQVALSPKQLGSALPRQAPPQLPGILPPKRGKYTGRPLAKVGH